MDKDHLFKLLTKNGVYFCEEWKDTTSTSLSVMNQCITHLDSYSYENGVFVFYKLKHTAKDLGYIDLDEALIADSNPNDNYIRIGKIASGKIDTISWIDKESYESQKDNLSDLITYLSNNLSDSDSITHNNSNSSNTESGNSSNDDSDNNSGDESDKADNVFDNESNS